MSTLTVLLPPLSRFAEHAGLQRWLQRGDRLETGASGELAASGCFTWPGGGPLPAAALLREHLCHDAGDTTWVCLDLAHVTPDMTGVRMLACGDLDVDADEAEALARPLRPLFGDFGMRLETTRPSRWHLRLPGASPLPAFSTPGDALGDDLARHLPAGDAGRRWRQLINETQILLHQSPMNHRRAEQGRMVVNSLWPWGGGRLPARFGAGVAAVHADDLLPAALATRAGIPLCSLNTFDATRRVAVDTLLDLGRSSAPQACVAMLSDLLQRRRVQALVLHFAGGERWRITRGQRWRFWRRGP